MTAPKPAPKRFERLAPKPAPKRFEHLAPTPAPAPERFVMRAPPPAASLVFALPYIGLMALSVLYPYFRIVRLPWFTMHAAYVAITGMACLWVFVTGNTRRVIDALKFLAIFGGLYVMMMIHSLSVWIFEQDGMNQIKRGIGTLLYQLLGIAAVSGAYVMFGKNALYYTFWGYVGGNLLLLASAVMSVGPSDFVSQIIAFYLSFGGEDTAASKAMEVHDLTFAFGEFVIFFWLFDKGKRGRFMYLIIAICFFLLGWKRIAIPGILLAGIYVLVMRKLGAVRARKWTRGLGIGLVGFSFAYLIIIRTGLFAEICVKLGIDTMGRIELLRFIESYYTISPLYMGYGIGFITRMMQDFIESGRAVLNAAMSIHNDILARYIELGFIGFTLWSLGLFYLTPRLISAHWSNDSMILFFAALIFCFLTYLTDNTAGYFHINFCLRLFPLALAANGSDADNAARSGTL